MAKRQVVLFQQIWDIKSKLKQPTRQNITRKRVVINIFIINKKKTTTEVFQSLKFCKSCKILSCSEAYCVYTGYEKIYIYKMNFFLFKKR